MSFILVAMRQRPCHDNRSMHTHLYKPDAAKVLPALLQDSTKSFGVAPSTTPPRFMPCTWTWAALQHQTARVECSMKTRRWVHAVRHDGPTHRANDVVGGWVAVVAVIITTRSDSFRTSHVSRPSHTEGASCSEQVAVHAKLCSVILCCFPVTDFLQWAKAKLLALLPEDRKVALHKLEGCEVYAVHASRVTELASSPGREIQVGHCRCC